VRTETYNINSGASKRIRVKVNWSPWRALPAIWYLSAGSSATLKCQDWIIIHIAKTPVKYKFWSAQAKVGSHPINLSSRMQPNWSSLNVVCAENLWLT
jgi:hypothetical protein